jgi:DNA gyrase subunit B
VWSDHHGAESAFETLKANGRDLARSFAVVEGDLIGLPVRSIKEIEPTNGYVYDFSVEEDENFIAGMGGICAKNTDADVDGSHIRTLLLTFFFRHFKILIERGYLYVAQPPLYKVKKGRKGQYLKDDTALEGYLFDSGCRSVSLLLEGRDGPVTDESLRELALDIRRFQRLQDNVLRNADQRGLVALVMTSLPQSWSETIKNQTLLENALPMFTESFKLRFGEDERVEMELEQDEENSAWRLLLTTYINGMPQLFTADLDLIESPEFIKLDEAADALLELGKPPYKVQVKDDISEVSNVAALVDKILAVAQKGLDIQRYKGLGEMNPDQLWETTMDPDVRTLLQVRIEDESEADDMFVTLMGDEVSIRREFIEKNALNVRNLDI